jgi:hypothetical protein
MKHSTHRTWRAIGVILMMGGGASAWTYSTTNTRPVTIADPAPGTESLESILDQIFGCSGCVGAKTDQSSAGVWQTSTQRFPTSLSMLQFSFPSTVPDSDVFGIWSDPTKLVPIYAVSATPGTSAILQWNSNGSLQISGDCSVIDCTTTSSINRDFFGFYLQINGSTYYTVDDLNPYNSAQALSYNYNNEWVIAFNDAPVTSSSPGAYNNLVVGVQSIAVLPEPKSLVLLGTAMLLVFAFSQRRFARKRGSRIHK